MLASRQLATFIFTTSSLFEEKLLEKLMEVDKKKNLTPVLHQHLQDVVHGVGRVCTSVSVRQVSLREQDESAISWYGGNRNSKHVSAGNLV